MDDLTFQSAGTLARLVRSRDVSASELVEAHLARIEALNPALNAIVTLDADGALQQARAVDASPGDGALRGVPITLKDCHETAGIRTTCGYPPLTDYVPTVDSTVAARLKSAGAILMGKTNVSTLLADSQSSNDIFGKTSNPWNLDRTAGGSSGGAGAAVSAGLSALDVGSDIGGSIRMPAHCCGIVGIKPTERRVSNHGHLPTLPGHPRGARYMNSIGPMARSIDDLALALSLIQGPDNADHDIVPPPDDDLPFLPEIDLRSFPLQFATSFPGLPVSGDTRIAIESLAGSLAEAGSQIEEHLPAIDFAEQLAVRSTLRRFARFYTDPPDETLSVDDLFRTLDRRDHFVRSWETFLSAGVLICPVMMTTAFPHCPIDEPVEVDGLKHPYSQVADYCRPFNLTGHPVVTIPIALDRDHLPIGIQIVGPFWSDARLLTIAKAIVNRIPPLGRPPERLH